MGALSAVARDFASLDALACTSNTAYMPLPRSPSHSADAWECSFLFDTARTVRTVSARGGLVVAGGVELHLVRPGAQNMSTRAPPLDIGHVFVAAAEPRAPWRYAVASSELVAVFWKGAQGDQVVRLRSGSPGPSATHLAWARADGASALYIRWDSGEIVRMKQDMSGVDTTDLPPMDAIASDDEGVLAMISLAGPEPRAFVTRDGETLAWRALPGAIAAAEDMHLAVADMAVAFAAKGGGAFVSRADEAPFVAVEPLAGGPLEFEGTSSNAPLFGVVHQAGAATIVRMGEGGDAIRIADFGSDGGVAPGITALSWDAPRRTLWAASPQMGLVTCVAPSAKGAKKPVMS
jgi:hypothetical protein